MPSGTWFQADWKCIPNIQLVGSQELEVSGTIWNRTRPFSDTLQTTVSLGCIINICKLCFHLTKFLWQFSTLDYKYITENPGLELTSFRFDNWKVNRGNPWFPPSESLSDSGNQRYTYCQSFLIKLILCSTVIRYCSVDEPPTFNPVYKQTPKKLITTVVLSLYYSRPRSHQTISRKYSTRREFQEAYNSKALFGCGVPGKQLGWKHMHVAYDLSVVRSSSSMNDHDPSLLAAVAVQIWHIRLEQSHENLLRRTFEGNKNFAVQNWSTPFTDSFNDITTSTLHGDWFPLARWNVQSFCKYYYTSKHDSTCLRKAKSQLDLKTDQDLTGP